MYRARVDATVSLQSAPSVLLIEDELPIRDGLTELFCHQGFRITAAGDGAAALSLLAREAFDLVILDLMLPKLPGLQVLSQLRHRDTLPPAARALLKPLLDHGVEGLLRHRVTDYRAGDLERRERVVPAGFADVVDAAHVLFAERGDAFGGGLHGGGALFLELPLGWWTERAGEHSLGYALIDWVEETMEMLGAALFLLSLIRYLREQHGELRLAPQPEDPPA